MYSSLHFHQQLLLLLLPSLHEVILFRTRATDAWSTDGSAGTLDADVYTFKMARAIAESMHEAQRNKSVYRPGRTNMQISRRTAPLWMTRLHFRQHARPVGAKDMR